MRSSKRIRCYFLASLLVLSAPAMAAWPDDQNIELVVGFAPGGGTDLTARAMAPFLERKLGGRARVVVVNKPGAAGEISTSYVSRSKPDGYTIGFINVPGFVFIPMYKKAAYQMSDLRIIARVVDDPAVLIARKDAQYSDLKSIVAALSKDPGSLSFATSGRGTSGHLALLKIERATGVQGTDIAYKGAGEFKSALVGGHVNYAFVSVAEFLVTDSESSPVRPLLLLNDKRMAVLPNVPTAHEEGYKILMSSERGIAGPAAMTDDIANRLQQAIKDTLEDPVFVQSVKSDAPVIAYMPGAQWTESLATHPASLQAFVARMQE